MADKEVAEFSRWCDIERTILPLVCLCLVALGTGATAVAGQTNERPGEAASTFHVESRLVVLDVTVTDRDGNLKSGLNKGDFVVTENGLPQEIKNFEGPADRFPAPAAMAVDRAGHESWGGAPLTMIVIDEMDTPFVEMAYARQCAVHYLKAQAPQLQEPTILLWLNDRGFHPLTGFTRNRDEILSSLQRHPSAIPDRLTRGASVDQLSAAFSALQQAALFSRGETGKKEIIWVGRGFPPINGVNLSSAEVELLGKAVRSTVNLLLASRVSLYVIDPTLGKSEILGGEAPEQVQTAIGSTPLAAGDIADPFARSFDMNFFVRQTGGRYFLGLNDLNRQIGESVQSGEQFYTLGYVPKMPESQFDYRRIQIRMSDPRLTAKTKQGYYPAGENSTERGRQPAEQGDADLRFDVYEASVTGMEYTGLKVKVERCQRESDSIHTTCAVRVETGSLTFTRTEQGDEHTAILAVMSSLNPKGNIIYHTAQRISFHVPESQRDRIYAGASQLSLKTIIPQGTEIVRVILRDDSGRIGTAEVDQKLIPKLVASAPVHLDKRR